MRRVLPWASIAVLPMLVLALLRIGVVHDSPWAGPTFHVYIVSFTSLLALIMAALMRVAAGQLRDARVLFLSLAFLGIAGIFLTHALTTPGQLVPANPWVGFSARLSLFTGAVLLALATVSWGPALQQVIIKRQTVLTSVFAAMLIVYGVVALGTSMRRDVASADVPASSVPGGSTSGYDHDHGPVMLASSGDRLDRAFATLNDPRVSYGLAAATVALLGFVMLRYGQAYRVSHTPLAAGFLASSIFLTQSQISMTIAPMWHASWWEYHLLMLAGFGAAMFGLVREYGQAGSLPGVVGGLLLRDMISQLQRGYTEVIVALVEAVEARDPYTRGHTQRVAEISLLIGQDLRLPPERLRILNQAAMLHDIGKIGIPDSVLNKPGALTPEEFAIIQEHPVRGHRIIQHVRSLQEEVPGVRHHHERLDGSGYPDGLRGDAIPLDARIIAVADVFDALTSARPYRGPWSFERALEILDEESGTRLDPTCVASLRRILPVWSSRAATQSGWQVAHPGFSPDPTTDVQPALVSNASRQTAGR